MNNYPSWWDQTITIYNKYEDPQTRVITWYRTVLTNCFWKYVKNQLVLGETVISTNSTTCRVPINSKFLERYKWVELPNDEMKEYFTFSQGDIIVRGEVDEEISEYEKGKRSTDFVSKHKALKGCIIVDTVAINVGGNRGEEHYHITGV